MAELTYAAVAVGMGKSVDHVRRLVREGKLVTNGKKGRGVRIIMDAPESAGLIDAPAPGLFTVVQQAGGIVADLNRAFAGTRQLLEEAADALAQAEQSTVRLAQILGTSSN